jgi:hypothetical protein
MQIANKNARLLAGHFCWGMTPKGGNRFSDQVMPDWQPSS